jgi:hypothetical protein
MPVAWDRKIARAERFSEQWLAIARSTRCMEHARRAVYARRTLRRLHRLRDRETAMHGVPTYAANSLCRLAASRGVDPLDTHALRAFVNEQGREGLLAGRNIGKRSVVVLLAWAAS